MKRLPKKISSLENQNKEKRLSKHRFGYKAAKIAALLLTPVVMLGSFNGCQAIKSFFNSSGSSVTDASGNTVYPPTSRRPPRTTAAETTVLSEIQQKMNLAPDLDGATKVIKKINGYERVTYEAKTGNPYGVESGVYLGEFKKEVTLEGKEVGGVALIPKVVEKLLKDGLASGKCWLVFVPADISELKTSDAKTTMETVDFFGFKDGALRVDFNETVSISNPIIDTKSAGVNNSMHSTFPSMPFGIVSNSISEKFNQNSIVVLGNFKFSEYISSYDMLFGKK